MRLLGGIMIMSGCLGLGIWYREQFIGRIQAMRRLVSILEMLKSEINYGKATLPESCNRLAERMEEPYRGCLRDIYRELSEERSTTFPELFCLKMEECLKRLPLKKEDRDIFLQPFRGQGFRDGSMQLVSLEQGLVQLSDSIKLQEQEQREKCHMAVGLGAMSGMLLLIILL